MRRQQLRQNPIFRRRVRGGAQPDDCVRGERMRFDQHQRAAENLDRVGEQHHAAFGHRIGERADEGSEHDIRHDEALLQRRRHPGRLVELAQQRDRGDQQGVIGERAEELRRHDRVEAGFHVLDLPGATR